MPITKTALDLSTLQQQVLDDMGIDAWYLTPLQRPQGAEDQQHHTMISGLVDSLSMPTEVSTNAMSASDLPALSRPVAEDNGSARALSGHHQSMAAVVQQTEAEAGKAVAVNGAQTGARRVHNVPTVSIDAARNVAPPAQMELFFPVVHDAPHDWAAVRQCTLDLSAQTGLPYCLGTGTQVADNLLVLPPPDYPLRQRSGVARETENAEQTTEKPLFNAAEQQLLTEILLSIGVSLTDCYATALLKQPMRYGLDPDAEILSAHLPLLAAELALSQPERLWLFGAAACHAVLQTAAPLSVLMFKNYTLSYSDTDNTTHQAEVICLPPLDYLLALPSEKASVWQRIKHLA